VQRPRDEKCVKELGRRGPFFFVPVTTLALASVEEHEMAGAAGLMNFLRTLAGAVATSVVTTTSQAGDAVDQRNHVGGVAGALRVRAADLGSAQADADGGDGGDALTIVSPERIQSSLFPTSAGNGRRRDF
jgi:hypothetical protein